MVNLFAFAQDDMSLLKCLGRNRLHHIGPLNVIDRDTSLLHQTARLPLGGSKSTFHQQIKHCDLSVGQVAGRKGGRRHICAVGA